jgi:hypothetical protein
VILYTDKKHRFGKTVNIEGIMVDFNLKGEAEISSKEELEILVKAGLSRTKEIEKEEKETVSVIKNPADKKVEELELKVKELENSIKLLSITNKSLEKELSEFRKENESAKATPIEIEVEKTDEEKDDDRNDESQKLIKELATKTRASLITLCEELELNKVEYKDLKVDDLRKYIIEKVENS